MPRYQPGDVIACYTVVDLLEDAPAREHRHYRVRAECCGRELVRAEQTLTDYGRRPPARCLPCSQTAANASKRASCGYLERFGPVHVVGRGAREGYWRVVWDCCGKEAELTRRYLVNLRRNHRLGQTPAPVCLTCSARLARVALAERNAERAALAAQRLAAQPAVARKTQRELEEGPVKIKGTAKFQPGVVSAAVAWPRPGAGA